MATSAVDIVDVSKSYGMTEALSGVSFTLEQGSIAALLGPSGCGKTTLLRITAGLVEPSGGKVFIGGRDMRGVRPYERNIGLVFQDYALFPHMTVRQNIAFGLHKRRFPKTEIQERVEAMLSLVRLRGLEERRPAGLSGGQQQRVALARALATEPELVLLDEPLSALDAKLRQELRLELKEILKTVGSSTIVVTHDQEEAMSLAERVVVMGKGRVLQEGAPSAIYRLPATKEVASFLGRSNWLAGRLGRPVDSVYREFLFDGSRLLVSSETAVADGECELCIRPERLRLALSDDVPDRANVFDGRVVDATALGSELHVTVDLDSGHRILAIAQDQDQHVPDVGRPVKLWCRPSDCVVLTS